MRNILKFSLIITLVLFFSCQQEELQLDNNSSNKPLTEIEKKLEAMHFNIDDVMEIDFLLPDGSTQKMYQVEQDIALFEEQILNMKMEGEPGTKQYHSDNLVVHGNFTIIGYTDNNGGFGLSFKERTALQWAVNNYNRLNLEITLELSFGADYEDKNMVVYHNPKQAGSGGKSGFPSFEKPYKYIQIFGMENFSFNANEHVLTHEIGHSFGLRHTDWFSRQSCGGFNNEGVGNDGANHIPGTPAGFDPNSVMLACFPANTNGEFNNNDIIALNFLY